MDNLIDALSSQYGFYKNGIVIVHNGLLRKIAKYIDKDQNQMYLAFPKDYKEFLEKTNGGELKFLSTYIDDTIQYTFFESVDDVRFNYQICSSGNISYLDFLTEDDFRTLVICVNSRLDNFGYIYGVDNEIGQIKLLACSFTDILNFMIKNLGKIKDSDDGIVSTLMNII
ncbi:SMI1-KNR4 cell-wall [uncultured archaeon]|nr:SMI1-KNR4 cell-wall [uncultured archaeon]